MGYPESFNEIDRWCEELRRTHAGEDVIHALEKRIEAERDDRRLQILNWFLANEHEAQGNEAAAHAARCRDPAMEIHDWHYEWMKDPPEMDILPVLEDRMSRETHPLRLHALRFHLASEYLVRGNYAAAEATYLADFEADPENPQPLIFLASQKLNEEEQPEAAMGVIERAVEVALRVGMWRRHALGQKARVALALDRPAIVEDVLRQLLGLTFTRGNADCGAERDFLDRLPPGSIDPDVARAYDDYCRERGVLPRALARRIDELILASAAPRWLKVARVMGDVLNACRRDNVAVSEYAIVKRVDYLVDHGKLQAQGNVYRPRYSEVRLPD
jgi:hypothetical protein